MDFIKQKKIFNKFIKSIKSKVKMNEHWIFFIDEK